MNMKSGYLYLETHVQHPGLLRCLIKDRMPSTEAHAGIAVRYVARFHDVEAAQMHLQNWLRRALLDIDEHLYQADLATAMAVVDSDDLRHERLWIDPELTEQERLRFQSLSEAYRTRRRRQDAVWLLVGRLALIFLLLGSNSSR